MNAVATLIPCIISGDSGTRLWPVSRESMPKPFIRLADNQSLLKKTFLVQPDCSLSLQMHHQRSEHWIVVSGIAQATNGDREFLLNTNESSFTPADHKHCLNNPGLLALVIIEVQSGEYLGEDDIVRFTDIYSRVHAQNVGEL
jgi:mannose-1-phosphate guanylyltransferase/mannose-6-phosphate isomerase